MPTNPMIRIQRNLSVYFPEDELSALKKHAAHKRLPINAFIRAAVADRILRDAFEERKRDANCRPSGADGPDAPTRPARPARQKPQTPDVPDVPDVFDLDADPLDNPFAPPLPK